MSVDWDGLSFPSRFAPDGKPYVAVYWLSDPITTGIRYVGVTREPELRYRQHIRTIGTQCNPAKTRWINMVLQQGLYPTMEIVGIYSERRALDIEMLLIAHLAPYGHIMNQRIPTEGQHERPLRRLGLSRQWFDVEDEYHWVFHGEVSS